MKILEDKNQREALVFIASVLAMAIIINAYMSNTTSLQERNKIVAECNRIIAENNLACQKSVSNYQNSIFNYSIRPSVKSFVNTT